MPTGCCVPVCTNQSGGFLFPTEEKRKEKWIAAVKRSNPAGTWMPAKYDVVCSRHFLPTDFQEPKAFGKYNW